MESARGGFRKKLLFTMAAAGVISLLGSYLYVCRAPALCAEMTPTQTNRSYRLPDTSKPQSYQIQVEPDLLHATFTGNETISLNVSKPTATIVLNSAELKVSKVLISADSAEAKSWPGTVSFDTQNERATFTFPDQLKPGDYKLSLNFAGILNSKLRGFYKSTYLDGHGKRIPLATTQMEATDARRMFPCYDEPAYKAKFTITAVIDPTLTAISNAPITATASRAGKKVVSFAQTPTMSSYLVALIVGNFEGTDPVVVDGVPIRVWAVQGKKPMCKYAQQFAARLLSFYNSYFGIAYPAKKLDLIAIPDFEAGAMENLGAITFRENELLVDDKTASTEHRQNVASVVAHEMAHMWFGDLVTMAWWDDLWLNEAFATWMSTKSVDYLMPQWHFWDQFGLARTGALVSDSLQSTRPIHFPVVNPDQANEMFDEITYEKGASILRMLEMHVGAKVFQEGVQKYLKKHAFANASTGELWQAVGEASGLPIGQLMNGWVNQPGYPLIFVRLMADGNKVHLEQSRFFLNAPTVPTAGNELWDVPVSIKGLEPENAGSEHVVLTEQGAAFKASPRLKCLFANNNADGFYRVQYSPQLLSALTPLIQTKLSPVERLSLLSDQWALTLSGRLSIAQYLQFTANYKTEGDPSVMTTLLAQLQQLDWFIDPASRKQFAAFVRDRMLPAKRRLGWTALPGESDLQKMLRADVLRTLGTIGQDSQTIAEARAKFRQLQQNSASVDPNLVRSITTIVAVNGNASDYAQIKRLWWTAKTPEAEERNLMALGLFEVPSLIKQSQQLSLTGSVRTQDAPHLLGTLMSNDAARTSTWQFIKQNWSAIRSRFPLNMVPRLVSSLSSMTTPEQESDLRSFFKTHPVPAGERSVAKMLEHVRINVDFRARNAQQLREWLTANFH